MSTMFEVYILVLVTVLKPCSCQFPEFSLNIINRDLQGFLCDSKLYFSYRNLCGSKFICPNTLDKFFCQTFQIFSEEMDNRGLLNTWKAPVETGFALQLNKSQLCTLSSAPDCTMARLSQRVFGVSPGPKFYLYWVIKYMNGSAVDRSNQLYSNDALTFRKTNEILPERRVYTVSHINFFVWLDVEKNLEDFDPNYCPKKIDRELCSSLPALKNRLVNQEESKKPTTPRPAIDDRKVNCGRGIQQPMASMCDRDLECPNRADVLLCRDMKARPFVCSPKIKLSLWELCIKNFNCPNELNHFICRTKNQLSFKMNEGSYVDLMKKNTRFLVQIKKDDLCNSTTSTTTYSPIATGSTISTPTDLTVSCHHIADRSVILYPNPTDRFNYFYWMIRDIEQFKKEGSSEFHSSEAFTHRFFIYTNISVHSLSHPNHFAEVYTTTNLENFDMLNCPKEIDPAICSGLPVIKMKLLSHSATG